MICDCSSWQLFSKQWVRRATLTRMRVRDCPFKCHRTAGNSSKSSVMREPLRGNVVNKVCWFCDTKEYEKKKREKVSIIDTSLVYCLEINRKVRRPEKCWFNSTMSFYFRDSPRFADRLSGMSDDELLREMKQRFNKDKGDTFFESDRPTRADSFDRPFPHFPRVSIYYSAIINSYSRLYPIERHSGAFQNSIVSTPVSSNFPCEKICPNGSEIIRNVVKMCPNSS